MHWTLLFLAATGAVSAPKLDQLLRDHAAARGGVAAIESRVNVALDLQIVEPGFTVDGRYTATRDGCMRIDVSPGASESLARRGA